LLEGIDLSGAKGVLVLITAAKGSLKLSESKLAMNTIRAYASADAHVDLRHRLRRQRWARTFASRWWPPA